MSDVFISYAREDQAFARRLAQALEAEGLSVWWDHTIPPGKTWNTYIARGIEEAKACIVVWSQHSVASKWVMEEATLANDLEKLLPVAIDGAPPPMGFRSMQSAQLQTWNGVRDHAQWQLLLREVRGLVGDRPRPLSQTKAPSFAPTETPSRKHAKQPWVLFAASGGVAIALLVFVYGALSRNERTEERAAAAPTYVVDAERTGELAIEGVWRKISADERWGCPSYYRLRLGSSFVVETASASTGPWWAVPNDGSPLAQETGTRFHYPPLIYDTSTGNLRIFDTRFNNGESVMCELSRVS